MGNDSDFHDLISTAFFDGRDHHGDLGLALEFWAERILQTVRKNKQEEWASSAVEMVERLHTRDLYLATGCAIGSEPAWLRFGWTYRKYLDDLVRYKSRLGDRSRDMADTILVDLFLPDRSGRSRIASYDGRSSLVTWLHVIVSHRLMNERERKCNIVEQQGEMPEMADGTALMKLEATLRTGRYEHLINDSLRRACEGLTPRERLILLWRYDDGLMLSEIARLLQVHTSTVARQLERLLQQVRGKVVSFLTTRYQLSDAAIDECLSDIVENNANLVPLLGLLRELGAQ